MLQGTYHDDVEADELDSARDSIGRFFGLSWTPFTGELEKGSHYSNSEIRETYRSLIAAIAGKPGLFLLTGPAGSGKTCLLRRLCAELRGAGHPVISQHTAGLTLAELFAAAAEGFGIDSPAGDIMEWLPRLQRKLAQRDGPPVLLAIDNGEQLGGDALMDIAALLRLDGSPGASLRILLCARPELSSRLDLPVFAGLKTNLAIACRLEPLSDDDAASYIFHRLRAAGRVGTELFTAAAINDIIAHTAGVPQRIDRLCLRSLRLAASAGQPAVTAKIVADAIDASSPEPAFMLRPPPPARQGQRSVVASSVAAAVLAASVLAYSFDRWDRSGTMVNPPSTRGPDDRDREAEAKAAPAELGSATMPADRRVDEDRAPPSVSEIDPAPADRDRRPQAEAAVMLAVATIDDGSTRPTSATTMPPDRYVVADDRAPPTAAGASDRPAPATLPEPAPPADAETMPADRGAAEPTDVAGPAAEPSPADGTDRATPAPSGGAAAPAPGAESPPAPPTDAQPEMPADAGTEPTGAASPAATPSGPPGAAAADAEDAADAAMRRGESQIADGHLTDPPGDNALETYRDMILVAPDGAAAHRLLVSLRAALGDAAREAFRAGRTADAQRYYELALDPQREAAAVSPVPRADASAAPAQPTQVAPPTEAPAADAARTGGEPRAPDAETVGSSAESQAPSGHEPEQLAARPPTPPEQLAARPPSPPEPPAAAPRLSADAVAKLIARGDQLLAIGDIAAARLFYQRAVESGNARAATALGKTQDPLFFRDAGAVGIRPDAAAAVRWYRQAADMGDGEAPARLRRLQAFMANGAGGSGDSRPGKKGRQ